MYVFESASFFLFEPRDGERCAAVSKRQPILVLGNRDFTSFFRQVGRFAVPGYDYLSQQAPGLEIAREPRGGFGYSPANSPTIHWDCFRIAQQNCTLKNRLELIWAATGWRYPWREVPPLYLVDESDTTLDVSKVDLLSPAGMQNLPLELKL